LLKNSLRGLLEKRQAMILRANEEGKL